jgi:putative ABC transport system permease protein
VNGYRLLLHLAPRHLRDRHAAAMEALFRQRLDESRSRGPLAVWLVWLHAARDLFFAFPTDWRRRWRQRGRIGVPAERRSTMFGSDIRSAWRALSHQKFGSAIVIAMLALGIGANVAVFALINGLFLKPLPFPDPERLVYINETAPRWNLEMTGITYADFAQWLKAQQAFDAIATFNRRSFNVAADNGVDRVDGVSVSADYAKVLGIEPVLGRMFTAEEDRPNGPNVALIGSALWHERFGGRTDVLGQTIRLNSRQFTIIGVLPPSAEFPGGVRLWTPQQGDPTSLNNYSLEGAGRLKAGVTLAMGADDLMRAHQPIFDARDKDKVVSPLLRDLRAHLTGDYDTIVSTLGAAVTLLLIVACANVAAVMLARALVRRREMGIRVAVGASRTRLLRQLLVENLILSAVGAVLGLAAGSWAIQLLVGSLPDQAPRWASFALDARTVMFTVGTCLVTALLFGWAPALHAMNADLRSTVASDSGGSTPAIRGRRTLRALVVAEFALASLMFVCGGLLVRAYDRVRNVDPGFDPNGVMSFTVSLPGVTYPDNKARLSFIERLESRLRELPGVTHAGAISCPPVSNCHWGVFYVAEGAPPRAPGDPQPIILNRLAAPGYFPAMGIRLKRGRFFADQDGREGADQPSVIIVNETFAKTLWPDGRDPVGQRVRQGEQAPWLTVVGLVADIKHYGLERETRPGVYLPLPRIAQSTMSFAVKTAGDPAALIPTARAIVREMDPELPIYNARAMTERMALSLTLRAAYSWMLAVFAAVALLLALGGSYGVTSYLVSQRTRELGIRVALGAQRADISRAVLKGSLAVVATGVILGIAGAVGAGRFLSSLLFGVPPYDALILTIAAVALFSAGLLANWLPARRAARVDPLISLRAD